MAGVNKCILKVVIIVVAFLLLNNCHRAQTKPISVAFTIKEKDLIPEGIIYDKNEKVFYIGSIFKHKIIKVDEAGAVTEFKKEREDGLYSALGMKIDSKRKVLWVCSYASDDFTEDKGSAGIFKYDLQNGKLIKKYLLDNKNGKHLFNDIIVTGKGDVFFTDSAAKCVYTINHEKDMIEIFIPRGTLNGPNGIALSHDGKYLFIADSAGISRADLKGNIKRIKTENKIWTGGCDGIYYYKNSIIAVQNDFRPERVVEFKLNNTSDRIKGMNVICQDNPLVVIPTTGVIVDDYFYIIANSQLNRLKLGKITDYEKLEDIRIVKIKL